MGGETRPRAAGIPGKLQRITEKPSADSSRATAQLRCERTEAVLLGHFGTTSGGLSTCWDAGELSSCPGELVTVQRSCRLQKNSVLETGVHPSDVLVIGPIHPNGSRVLRVPIRNLLIAALCWHWRSRSRAWPCVSTASTGGAGYPMGSPLASPMPRKRIQPKPDLRSGFKPGRCDGPCRRPRVQSDSSHRFSSSRQDTHAAARGVLGRIRHFERRTALSVQLWNAAGGPNHPTTSPGRADHDGSKQCELGSPAGQRPLVRNELVRGPRIAPDGGAVAHHTDDLVLRPRRLR
jgi:hypothetical protein